MIFEGSYDVFIALKEKKRLMEAGEAHDHIRPLILFGGGLMKGVYGVGAALALEELGYTDCFEVIVGVSSGAPTAAHFASASVVKGQRLVSEEYCNPRFYQWWRLFNQVDTEFFMDALKKDPEKRVDVEAAVANPAELYFGVSEYETGLPKLLSAEDKELFFDSMHASLTMQNVSRHRTYIDGVLYTDGGFTKPHVISETFARFKDRCTHFLIITNNDRDFIPISIAERILNRTVFRIRLNGAITAAINSRREERDKALEQLRGSDIPSALVWGDGSVKSTEQNPDRVRATVESSRIWWHGLLAE